jgi:putative Mg2+ transporter-C (MgtC) family protein
MAGGRAIAFGSRVDDVSMIDVVWRLVLAAVLTGLVGLEREMTHHQAGLRTHMAVGLGASLFAVVGDTLGDTRIAAQVVSGIGFLGAGAILREGMSISGLTTAAGLWTAAAIGLAAGVGEWRIATAAALVLTAVLFGLRPIEAWIHRTHPG